MSFILDQLKKSGKQRELELAMLRQKQKSEERSVAPVLMNSAERRALFRGHNRQFGAVAVLIAVAALYGAASLLNKGDQPGGRSVVAEVKGSVQKASPLSSALSSDSPDRLRNPQAYKAGDSGAEGLKVEQRQTAAARPAEQVNVSERVHDAPLQADSERPAEEAGSDESAARSYRPLEVKSSGRSIDGSVMEYKQLPPAVKESLPDLRITSHLYKRDSRLVSINGRIMTEGLNMDGGLLLEEITPEGAVLSYGKYRFLVRAGR